MPQRASVDWEFPATAYDVVAMGLYRNLNPFQRLSADQRARVTDCL